MQLPLPKELEELLQERIWPRTNQEAVKWNLHRIAPKEVIGTFAPEEDRLFLLPPPFLTIKERMETREATFWMHEMASVHEIDPSLAVVIADFGLGSDAPIILDYRDNCLDPSVLRLRWSTDSGKPSFSDNHWIKIASTFAEFAGLIGLNR
jgi:hypothetical protein